ncbi:hypothetical protein FA15DRAFT_592283 [Coprinopsis marcescibilis]|uniref:Uncharacterized protein n=1 Tax=Coprinopsis marcescibilis TaxID=230819 RepID=A0A5C3KW81_COPMA|nr:hypothetical protein FA15DRAFT_592283 [Coprinopsis marcescibilis]
MAHNSIHVPVLSSQYSTYSSLSGAVSQPSQGFQSPFRRWLPQTAYVPASKWRAATATSNLHLAPVSFDLIGYAKQGVLMRDLSTRSVPAIGQLLAGATDAVMASTGLKQITLRIMWPGYTHVDWARVIELNAPTGPITRAHLALLIAQNFSRFVELARSQSPTAGEYIIAPGGIQYEHLVLVGLHNVFEDVWQADVAIDRR